MFESSAYWADVLPFMIAIISVFLLIFALCSCFAGFMLVLTDFNKKRYYVWGSILIAASVLSIVVYAFVPSKDFILEYYNFVKPTELEYQMKYQDCDKDLRYVRDNVDMMDRENELLKNICERAIENFSYDDYYKVNCEDDDTGCIFRLERSLCDYSGKWCRD